MYLIPGTYVRLTHPFSFVRWGTRLVSIIASWLSCDYVLFHFFLPRSNLVTLQSYWSLSCDRARDCTAVATSSCANNTHIRVNRIWYKVCVRYVYTSTYEYLACILKRDRRVISAKRTSIFVRRSCIYIMSVALIKHRYTARIHTGGTYRISVK